ncbi:MAG: tetratricopeptide repeat protein, partial [Candidatus Paceibacterota bacterium]
AIASFEKALSYDTLGRPEVVERMIETVPAVNSSAVSIEVKQKFFETARNAIETQLKRAPGDARYELFAGTFYSNYGLRPEATSHYVRAHELSPGKQTILFQLGSFYINGKEYDKALDAFKQAYELDASYGDAAKYYSVALIYAGREAEAKKFFKEHLGDAPMTDDFFVRAYADLGLWPKAVELLRIRIRSNPNNLSDRTSLVSALLQMGDRKGAVEEIRRIVEINPAFKAEGDRYIQEIQAGRNP